MGVLVSALISPGGRPAKSLAAASAREFELVFSHLLDLTGGAPICAPADFLRE